MNKLSSTDSSAPSNVNIRPTSDQSHTVYSSEFGVTYHSVNGALTESRHVFIAAGLACYCNLHPDSSTIDILEVGFGTGLNALLACIYAADHHVAINYTGVEKFPIETELARQLNYPDLLDPYNWAADVLLRMHKEMRFSLSQPAEFTFEKWIGDFARFQPAKHFDVVFFDAFAPATQPELWTRKVFEKVSAWLRQGGIFVTYSAKGSVRRALVDSGFHVERIAGPPGKREMLRATKT